MRLITLAAWTAFCVSPVLAHDGHGGLVEHDKNTSTAGAVPAKGRLWLPGDHHIHSEFSADYEPNPASPQTAPTPLLGKDGRYSIARNAEMARRFGLGWMVSTDHGGPNHSKLNYEQAWPEVHKARAAVPEMLIFYGMEFDTPAGDHSSLIIPFTGDERAQLRAIESGFSKRDPWPADKAWDSEGRMIDALKLMRDQKVPPVLIANHPSRSASAPFAWGLYTPAEFRNWNDTAPMISVGMEGAPGHQAAAINTDGSIDATGARGGYRNAPTLGGFDQMTAQLGGFWDSMLGEGRRWWITATSDSHSHWRDGGSDFWPGEYSKTYVHARREHRDVLDGVRNGRMFVTTGDLISELDVTVTALGGRKTANMGGAILVKTGDDVEIVMRLRDPSGANHGGHMPEVARVDLIIGDVTGPVTDRSADVNPSTRVEKRFAASDWTRSGEVLTMRYTLRNVQGPFYVRVRGTNTSQIEPTADAKGENPWEDLWFYSNPIFVKLARP